MKIAKLLSLLLVTATLLPAAAYGRLIDGFACYSSAISGSTVRAVAVQQWDGKVVIGGSFTVNRSDIVQKNLARINTDGTLDTTFTASARGEVHAIAVQPDPARPAQPDKSFIVIGGAFDQVSADNTPTGTGRNGLARLENGTGSLDTLTVALPGESAVNAITVDSAGDLLIGGRFQATPAALEGATCSNIARVSRTDGAFLDCFSGGVTGGEVNVIMLQGEKVIAGGGFQLPAANLARFSDGAHDETFTFAPGGEVWSLALQVDEKIVVGGDFPGNLRRTDGGGAPDAGFDPAPGGRVSAIALQTDGRILIGGSFPERLARLELDGSLDPAVAPELNGTVNAVVLQPDGKFLAGGEFTSADTRTRPLLARFYRYGTLDDDVRAPFFGFEPDSSYDTIVTMAFTGPDGMVTVGGIFYYVWAEPHQGLVRLNPDWSWADETVFARTELDADTYVFLPQPDGRMTLLGQFNYLGEIFAAPKQVVMVKLMPDGTLDTSTPFNQNITALLSGPTASSWAGSAYRTPEGLYVGGVFAGADYAFYSYLLRLDEDGVVDATFQPEVHSTVPPTHTSSSVLTRLARDPWTGKSFVGFIDNGGTYGTFYRLLENWQRDPGFATLYLKNFDRQFNMDRIAHVEAILPMPDGKVLLGGSFRYPGDDFETGKRWLLRLDDKGGIDDSLVLEFRNGVSTWSNEHYSGVYELTYQSDGKVVVGGFFDEIKDADGVWKSCNSIALLDPATGKVDCPLGAFLDTALYGYRHITFARHEEDGKLMIGGCFDNVDGDFSIQHLARVNIGNWVTQDLQVSSTGRTVTWQRGGAGAELRSVTFEYSDDGSSWEPLGEGSKVDGVWTLDGLDLVTRGGGYRQNRYVRALGYRLEQNNSGIFFESVRMFNLKPGGAKQDQSVNFTFPDKTYGDADFEPVGGATSDLPVTYSSSNTKVAVVEEGKIRITGAGDTDITGIQGGNSVYNSAQAVRTLHVFKAPLTVSADDKARAYLTPNPPFTWSYRGFVKGESEHSVVITGTPSLSSAAVLQSPVGDYPITVKVDGMSASNYRFQPGEGTLSVLKSCQEIVFPPLGEVTYGDEPFQLKAYSCAGLPIGFSSSKTQVARVAGSTVTIVGAGSAVITASQTGSDDLERAPDVSRTLLVHKASQQISFPELTAQRVGAPPLSLRAAASSGLPVGYRSSDLTVAKISGGLAEIVGAGSAVITAIQGGSANYDAALPVSHPLTVSAEADPPLLTLSTLRSGAVTADPVLNVTGSASDPSGIASLTVNGSEMAASAPLFSSAVLLAAGRNSIEISASDGAGNKTLRNLVVEFDAAAPRVELSEPSDNSVTNVPFFTVKGSAPAGAQVNLAVNGAPPAALGVTGGSFTGSGYLREGLNTVEVTAELAGRSSTAKRSVRLAPAAPFLAISEPAADLRTERGSVLVRGVAGAQGGQVSLLLEVEGKSYAPALQGGSFQQEVVLEHEGETRVTATASDPSGNRSVAQRNIVRFARVLGDLTGDALVDLRDALALLRISLGSEPVTPEALLHGDVAPLVQGAPQPDGRIDIGDILVLLRKIVGLVDF